MRSITPIMNGAGIVSGSPMPTDSGSADVISDHDFVSVVNSHATINNVNGKESMPERLSPDGADEGDELQIMTNEFEDDAWSDWETEKPSDGLQQMMDEKPMTDAAGDAFETENSKDSTAKTVTTNYQRNISISSSTSTATNNNPTNDNLIKDIKDLEIKPVANQLDNEIDDLFKDMEPVIEVTNSIASLLKSPPSDIPYITRDDSPQKTANNQTQNKINQNRFAMTVGVGDDENFDDAAWGDEANDWDN